MADRKLYDTGWNDAIDYASEKRALYAEQNGGGLALMILGALFGGLGFVIPLMMWLESQTIYNYGILVFIAIVAIVLWVSGFFLEKKYQKNFKNREDEFYRKWFKRWDELGFNGEE